jgi:FAD/FMN-containing dehydrogenase/Fe-S oxidoreductase
VAVRTIRPAHTRTGDPLLAERLRREVQGEVLFGPFDRGRYSTDASIYQIEPLGVVVPRTVEDVEATLAIAREEQVSVLPRGGGTSQAGQTVGRSIVIDNSKHLTGTSAPDFEGKSIWVEPGVVLDQLNRALKPYGVFFPVDISTGSRATLGGMAANNACGSRSLRYGVMVDNVLEIEAILADGERMHFAEVSGNLAELNGGGYPVLVQDMRALAAREARELEARIPKTGRHVGGYNLHRVDPQGPHNMASLLVGSEGTLAYFSRIRLKLSPLPRHKTLGVCHFPTFHDAMASAQHIVKLGPTAVELVDRSILELAREIPAFADLLPRFVKGEPDALLLVEFAGEDLDEQKRGLMRLSELMGELGFPGAVVEIVEPGFQSEVWELRKAGLNIVMSMKGDRKPVSFIEDCAVPLEHLADYTAALNEVFARHGTSGTWYAHASVGCLHVRPILNLKQEMGVRAMREIAEEAIALVRRYKGAHSGEHGDGIVRSEFNEPVFGSRLARAFEEVKDRFDPNGLFNSAPSKVVRPPRMDDRSLMRFPPGYAPLPLQTELDWSAWGSFLGAAEMCNNNGACRKAAGGVMCPSYRATMDEQHVTRGRANSLRLALSGQLGPDALTSDDLYGTLDLCVSCKGCRRECPTGVDVARMKAEFLYHYRARHGLPAKERLIAYLPRYAPFARRVAPLMNLRDRIPGLAWLSELALGFSARRTLPAWRRDALASDIRSHSIKGDGRDVLLLVDTFSRYFEPENASATVRVLEAAGYRVHGADPPGGRPLCCGRTFLAGGLIDEARKEAERMLQALAPYVEGEVPVVGLEPSCLLTLRDEFTALLPGEASGRLARRAMLIGEFLCAERDAGRLDLPLRALPYGKALVHGHCHEKAFGAMPAVVGMLKLVPGLDVETIESSCCGMAGAFGYEARHFEVSMRMAELSLLPAVRGAPIDAALIADGTSCRHQIKDGAGREALHAVRILDQALA